MDVPVHLPHAIAPNEIPSAALWEGHSQVRRLEQMMRASRASHLTCRRHASDAVSEPREATPTEMVRANQIQTQMNPATQIPCVGCLSRVPSVADVPFAPSRPGVAERDQARSMIDSLRQRKLLSGKANAVRLNVVACAHALHVGESFESDSQAKRIFGVPRTTNVRSWVQLLQRLSVPTPGRKRGRPPNSSYTAEELQQRRDARARAEREADERHRAAHLRAQQAKDEDARDRGFANAAAFRKALNSARCAACGCSRSNEPGSGICAMPHCGQAFGPFHASDVPPPPPTPPVRAQQPYCEPFWCSAHQPPCMSIEEHRRRLTWCAWCRLAPPLVGALSMDRSDGAWYCQGCWDAWDRDEGGHV